MGPSYAGMLGPIAFVTMLLRGLISGSSANSSLLGATVCLLVFAAIGYVLGSIADRVVLESVNRQLATELKARAAQAEPASPRPDTNSRRAIR